MQFGSREHSFRLSEGMISYNLSESLSSDNWLTPELKQTHYNAEEAEK